MPKNSKRTTILADILFAQGFGTRKDCRTLIRAGLVAIGYSLGDAAEPREPEPQGPMRWNPAADPDMAAEPPGLWLRVRNEEIPYKESLFLAFHKPPDCECSHSPTHHRSVFSFFPEPFQRRKLEAVGRLDADTTGLLLLSDNGDFIHHLTSPKRHVPKTYRVGLKHPVSPEQVAKLTAGVELRGNDEATGPATVVMEGERACSLTISEGRYHQVKRMFAAVGNRVETIHRIAIGALALEAGLAPGAWRYLSGAEIEALGFRP